MSSERVGRSLIEKNFAEDPTWYVLNQCCVIDVTTMSLSDDLVQSKCDVILIWTANCFVDWRVQVCSACSSCSRNSAVKDDTSCMRIQNILTHSMQKFVKKLSGEEHVVKVTVNMGGNAKPTTWLSNAPKVAKRLSVFQRSQQVRPKKLVAASITGFRRTS